MSVEETVRDYYDALRHGDPLSPYFLEDGTTVKFGVSEAAFGYDDVASALREQTKTTGEWRVESRSLVVDERGDHAIFADEVDLAWDDHETGASHEFDTRWSGVLERRSDVEDWYFVSMHVSAPHEL